MADETGTPIADLMDREVNRNNGETTKRLDSNKIAELKNHPERKLDSAAGEYVEAIDVVLQGWEGQKTRLKESWDQAPDNAKDFAKGIWELKHLTPKDFDRVVARKAVQHIIEIGYLLQVKKGTETVSDEQISEKIAACQEIWNELSDRSRAQVMREVRSLATENNLWEKTKAGAADWTWQQTVKRGQKEDLSAVLTDMVGKLRLSDPTMTATEQGGKYSSIVESLQHTIDADHTDNMAKLNVVITNLEGSVSLFEAQPAAQKAILEQLGKLKIAQERYQQLVSGTRAHDGIQDNIADDVKGKIQGKIVGLLADSDRMIASLDAISKKAGWKGRLAAQTIPFIDAAEVNVVAGEAGASELAVMLASRYENAAAMGWLGEDVRVRLGTVATLDFNRMLDIIPFAGGLRHNTAELYGRADEQLDVLHKLSSGALAETAKSNLAVLKDSASTFDQKAEAVRNLKSVGMDMKILSEFAADIQRLATTDTTNNIPKEMLEIWKQLVESAKKVHAELASIPKEAASVVSDETKRDVGVFAIDAVATHTQEDPSIMLNRNDYAEWFADQTTGIGRGVRKLGANFFKSRSPAALLGVEVQADESFELSGVGQNMAVGLEALKKVSAASPENMLITALEQSQNMDSLHAAIALFMTRAGHGEAFEVARSLFTKLKGESILGINKHLGAGVGTELAGADVMNKLQIENLVALLATAGVVIEAMPIISHGASHVAEWISVQAAGTEAMFRGMSLEAQQAIEGLKNFAIQISNNAPSQLQNSDIPKRIEEVARLAGEAQQAIETGVQYAKQGMSEVGAGISWIVSGAGELAKELSVNIGNAVQQGVQSVEQSPVVQQTSELLHNSYNLDKEAVVRALTLGTLGTATAISSRLLAAVGSFTNKMRS